MTVIGLDGSDFPDVKLERVTKIDAQVIVCLHSCIPKFSPLH